MDVQSMVRAIMAEQHVTLEAMGERLGGINKVSVCQALGAKQRSMGVERAVGMLDALGYDLVAVPKGSKLPKGAMVVERREDAE